MATSSITPKSLASGVRNIAKIHPLKQNLVKDIVSDVTQDDEVNKIIVFGSAASDRCNEKSDLDICVVWNFECFDDDGIYVPKADALLRRISRIGKGNVDVMPYTPWMSDRIKKEIKKGITVYVQDVKKV